MATVYDLLTLEPVWSESATKYTAFAVAPSEDYLLPSAPQGWIAVTSTVESEQDTVQHKVHSVYQDTALFLQCVVLICPFLPLNSGASVQPVLQHTPRRPRLAREGQRRGLLSRHAGRQ